VSDYCIDGGSRHSWDRRGLDVRGDKLVWVQRCIYCPKERTRRFRGWKRGNDGRVRT
jgi:hypothetical protein